MEKISDDRSEKRKISRREISAGGVVYKKSRGKILVLLIMPAEDGKPSSKWALPKGWVGDHGQESMRETALREVREEAGVEAEIEENLGQIKYTFIWNGDRIFKIVGFFLMKYKKGDPKNHDWETFEAKWFPIAEAPGMMTYKTERGIVEKAAKILAERQN